MTSALRPATEQDLSEIIRAAEAPLEVIGTATKRGLGRPVQAGGDARHVGLFRHHLL